MQLYSSNGQYGGGIRGGTGTKNIIQTVRTMKLDIYKYLFEIFHKLRIAVGEVNVVVGEGGGERDRYFRRKI